MKIENFKFQIARAAVRGNSPIFNFHFSIFNSFSLVAAYMSPMRDCGELSGLGGLIGPQDRIPELPLENTTASSWKALLKPDEGSEVCQVAQPPWGGKQLRCTEKALFPPFSLLLPQESVKNGNRSVRAATVRER